MAWPLAVRGQPRERTGRGGARAEYSVTDLLINSEAFPSLTRQLGTLLEKAETLFGPRDKTFTLLGIEFHAGPNRLSYPNAERDQIVVELSMEATRNRDQALFQLAHETVHILAPVNVGATTVLEEGLATYFSLTAPHFANPTYAQRSEESLTGKFQPYRDALDDVRALLFMDPTVVSRIRQANELFGSIPVRRLREAAPHCPMEVATRLTRTFTMEK
jgi:hypothetical protein